MHLRVRVPVFRARLRLAVSVKKCQGLRRAMCRKFEGFFLAAWRLFLRMVLRCSVNKCDLRLY